MILTASKVTGLHGRISRAVTKHLGYPVTIKEVTPGNWRQFSPGRRVDFQAFADLRQSDRAADVHGNSRHVITLSGPPFPVLDSGPWASWYEEWRAEGGRRFSFLTATWTFFYGLPGQQRMKRQLFRGEWRKFAASGDQFAHPHWHFDFQLPRALLPQPTQDPGDGGEVFHHLCKGLGQQ